MQGSDLRELVELRGFEPLTPSMRTLGVEVARGRWSRPVADGSLSEPLAVDDVAVFGCCTAGPPSAIPLATASSASRWHRRTYVLLPVTGGDLAHGLRVGRFAWREGCKVCRGLAEELLDARR